MTLGQRLEEMRLERGYSIEFVAVNIGVTVNNYEKYESDARIPPLKRMKQISDLYRVPIGSLFGDSDLKIDEKTRTVVSQTKMEALLKRTMEAGISAQKLDEFIEFTRVMNEKKLGY